MFWDRVWRWVDVDVGGAGVWSRSGWNPQESSGRLLRPAQLGDFDFVSKPPY